jgi:hypothetical protein
MKVNTDLHLFPSFKPASLSLNSIVFQSRSNIFLEQKCIYVRGHFSDVVLKGAGGGSNACVDTEYPQGKGITGTAA